METLSAHPNLSARLAEIIGVNRISTTAEELAVSSGDKSSASHPPVVLVFAESTADASAVLRFAN